MGFYAKLAQRVRAGSVSIQTGPKGGRFYTTPTGTKVYGEPPAAKAAKEAPPAPGKTKSAGDSADRLRSLRAEAVAAVPKGGISEAQLSVLQAKAQQFSGPGRQAKHALRNSVIAVAKARGIDVEAAEKHLDEAARKFSDKLSERERELASRWGRHHDRAMRSQDSGKPEERFLREGVGRKLMEEADDNTSDDTLRSIATAARKEQKERWDKGREALEHFRERRWLDEGLPPVMLSRGLSVDAKTLVDFASSDRVAFDALSSTTYRHGIADGFAKGVNSVVLHIVGQPKGCPVSVASRTPDEREVLVPKGNYRVVSRGFVYEKLPGWSTGMTRLELVLEPEEE